MFWDLLDAQLSRHRWDLYTAWRGHDVSVERVFEDLGLEFVGAVELKHAAHLAAV